MAKHAALFFLAVSSPVLLLTFVVDHPASEALFAFLVALFPVALIALGAQREGRLGPLLWPLITLGFILMTCIGAMLTLRGAVTSSPWFGGLPLPAAVQFYGLFLLPLLLVSLTYSWTFDRFTLKQRDLDNLRHRFKPEGSNPKELEAERLEVDEPRAT